MSDYLIGHALVFNVSPLDSGILVELLDELGYLSDDFFSDSEGKVGICFCEGSSVDSDDIVLALI